jgi:futalosine hydrolase
MNILVIAATKIEFEWAKKKLKNKANIQFMQTNVGLLATCFNLMKAIMLTKPSLIIQIGIGGCLNKKIPLTKTFYIKQDSIADLGVWENGKWKNLADLSLTSHKELMYTNHHLLKKNHSFTELQLNKNIDIVNGITVNQISTQKKFITNNKNAVIETMEGAALHFVCNNLHLPYLQIRSTSNYVGERNKAKWKIKEAIQNVNEELVRLLNN